MSTRARAHKPANALPPPAPHHSATMRAPARIALLALALALAATTTARPIEDKVGEVGGEEEPRGRAARRADPPLSPPPPQPHLPRPSLLTTTLRHLLQLNSTQTTGPWAQIVGTTAIAFPGYYPRLNLTRTGPTQITSTNVPDPARISSFPTQDDLPALSLGSVSGSVQAGGSLLLDSGLDLNDPAITGPPGV